MANRETAKLRVLELYSGIGGMHYGLKLSKLDAEIVAAVDINPHANLVYKHNFPDTKIIQKTIEGIKLDELNGLDFDMILMSPPCQPFTRQGNQNGVNDARAKSFLSLLDQIPNLNKRPKFILIENVKGFEADEAHHQLIEMLKKSNYIYQEFLLSPIQFGIPNTRLRYFLIAKLCTDGAAKFSFQHDCTRILTKIESNQETNQFINDYLNELRFDLNLITSSHSSTNEEQSDRELFGLIRKDQLNEQFDKCSQISELMVDKVKKLAEFVLNEMIGDPSLRIDEAAFSKSLHSIDLVTSESTRSSCFTKNYGRYIDGTGSLLKISNTNATNNQANESGPSQMLRVDYQSIRFFSPKEISNLHCFPNQFQFPTSLTTLQKWKLIGNSLNVLIVGVLINLMTK